MIPAAFAWAILCSAAMAIIGLYTPITTDLILLPIIAVTAESQSFNVDFLFRPKLLPPSPTETANVIASATVRVPDYPVSEHWSESVCTPDIPLLESERPPLHGVRSPLRFKESHGLMIAVLILILPTSVCAYVLGTSEDRSADILSLQVSNDLATSEQVDTTPFWKNAEMPGMNSTSQASALHGSSVATDNSLTVAIAFAVGASVGVATTVLVHHYPSPFDIGAAIARVLRSPLASSSPSTPFETSSAAAPTFHFGILSGTLLTAVGLYGQVALLIRFYLRLRSVAARLDGAGGRSETGWRGHSRLALTYRSTSDAEMTTAADEIERKASDSVQRDDNDAPVHHAPSSTDGSTGTATATLEPTVIVPSTPCPPPCQTEESTTALSTPCQNWRSNAPRKETTPVEKPSASHVHPSAITDVGGESAAGGWKRYTSRAQARRVRGRRTN